MNKLFSGSAHSQEYDVIVLGAGIVGLALAALLSETDMKVAVIDKHKPQANWQPEHYDLRVSAITKETEALLKRLQLWKKLSELRVSPYDKMQVWDGQSFGKVDFDAAEVGQANLGNIIENSAIQNILMDRLSSKHQIEFILERQAAEIQMSESQVKLLLSDGSKCRAKLLIGADGGQSWLRQYLDIPTTSWDYEQKALVATVKTELEHNKTARQIFLPTGTLAFLPLPESQLSSIVWAGLPEETEALCEMNENEFKIRLRGAFQNTLGDILEVSKRVNFPLSMRHAKEYIKPRVALIGDAIHTIHPLAGQGLNLGLQDARALADIIIDAYAKQKDIGVTSLLRRYQRQRKAPNWQMILLMEAFKRGFTSQHKPLELIRNLGMSLSNRTPIIKKKLIQEAMGLNRIQSPYL